MHGFAQTNIQLLNQLRSQGYTLTELVAVAQAYGFAIRLFTGRFRPTGKTFLAHLVGTASILGGLRRPHQVVVAGLLHAVYMTGDFGDGRSGISDPKRTQVRSAVGAEVEEFIARYTALSWNVETIPGHADRLPKLVVLDRDVLLIRLANELEEYLDLGVLYSGEEKRRRTDYLNDSGRLMLSMAEQLGYPKLAADLSQVFDEVAAAEIPSVLLGPEPANASFLLAPQSYQRVMEALARRLAGAQVPSEQPASTTPLGSSPLQSSMPTEPHA